ncbi:MAG: HAD family hydrolase [Chitinophagia bacterium]|nr:HAD family hydrolase [Chitinophagia bacterium]
MYRDMFLPHFEIARGLRVLLETAKASGAGTALASNGPVSNVVFAMEKGNLFPLIDMAVSAYQVGKPKPAPDVYFKAMELIGATPETSIIFEDSKTGLQAAQNTGCIVVGITTTLSKAEMEGRADYAIDSFEEIDIAWIQRVLLSGKAKPLAW